MTYDELLQFIQRDMRMSHVYQPVMLLTLLSGGGKATVPDIAQALLGEDRSQLEYYAQITKFMVGKVLRNRGVVSRNGPVFELIGYSDLSPEQVSSLQEACSKRLAQYVARRGESIWQHRRHGGEYISGTLRYDVLKAARFRCELCGVSADERALEVDHIRPKSRGGTNEISNLQALCYSCNAMKRDRDDTDFRGVRISYALREPECPFCNVGERSLSFENTLAYAVMDSHPVSKGHTLVVPKRHVKTYFELGTPEVRACHDLLMRAETQLRELDAGISGVNVGINSGESAGQTVMHCHIHLIPRRAGDHPNPRGGVRGVISGKADY